MLSCKNLLGVVIFITVLGSLVDSKYHADCMKKCKTTGINIKKCRISCKIPKVAHLNGTCWNVCVAELGGSQFKTCMTKCILKPVNCQWKQWTDWGTCTECLKCCERHCIRTRGKTPALRGGKPCMGSHIEYQVVKCSKTECSQPDPSPGTCGGWGVSHYTTFDGLRYDFQGDCKYILLRSVNGAFKIEVKHIRTTPTSTVSFTIYADVYVGDDVIRLGRVSPVTVNRNPIALFPYNTDLYSIEVNGATITF
ncbi:unnamed protein product, partial [Owenia fusiformis]